MKRIFGFGWKKKGQPPSGSGSLPRPAGAYEIREKDLGKLHRAAASGNLAQVRKALKKCSIDERDKEERTPLHLASANGHVDVVTYLVERKCNLDLFDNDNRSPLMKAVQCQQEKCVAILLEHGADPNLADVDGNTPLHLSVISPNTTVAELLLEYDADIDAQNKEGCTPLILAISEHQEDIVIFLLRKGADVHARDLCKRTPLMTAASCGELNLIKFLLLYGADVSHKDTNGWTAEDHAVIHGYSSLSLQLAVHTGWENTGQASAGAPGLPVLSSPYQTGAAGITWGAPAVDRGGMQQSPKHTSRTGKSRKAIDDLSQGDSISSEKEENDDSWHTSEEEELDFTPKKLQKPNLSLFMNASQKFRKKNDGDGFRTESPKSPKKSLKQKTPSDTNLNKGECGELLNRDVSDASNLEEEEKEDDDENNNGDYDGDYEEQEEEEKEEEDQEYEETQSKDIPVEKQRKKTKPKGEINQKFKYFSNAKYKGEARCGTADVCDDDHKIIKELEEKVEESVDTPVSFIAGCYEKLQENIAAMSPKIMNNEVSCKSVPKQAVFQNLNNLQDTQESRNRKSVIQEKFHRNADSCSADSEMTDWKKEMPQPLSDSCLKEKKSSVSDGFENGNNSWSAAKSPKLESQRPNYDDDTEEEEYEKLKQGSKNLRLNRSQENLKAAFHSSTKGESPERQEEEEKQEKEDTGEALRTAVLEGVKNSICNDNHQVHNTSKENADALPAVGAEEEEDNDSPWDSEVIDTDSESLRKVSPGVFLPAADRHGACSQIVSGERNNDFSEKPSNSQLKTPERVLEMNETSPEKRQQQSDLFEEFGLGDADDIEDALPAVGAEEEEDNDSPWDSEVIDTDSESLRKVSPGVFLPAADRHGACSQIVSGERNNDFSEKPSNSQLKTPERVLEMNETSPEKRQQQSDLFEEFGLGDADDIEDALPAVGAEEEEDNDSPWDSEVIDTDSESLRKVSPSVFLPAADRHGACSQIVSGERNNDFSEKPSNSQLKTPERVLEMNETSPEKRQQQSDLFEEFGLGDADDIEDEYSGSTCHMSSSAEKEDIKDAFENDEMPDKLILETTNLIQKTACENQTDKAEIPHQEALVENEELHSADMQLSPKPWEERYERMWVENEKRELKTNFKSITAELKQLFGEINETRKTTSLVGEMSEDGFREEVKSSRVVSSRVTESDNKLENKDEFGDTKLKRGGKVPKMEIVIPSLSALPDQNNLNANLEGSWSTDEEDSTNHTDNIKVPLAEGEEEKMPVMEMEENENGSSRNVMGRPEYSLRHNLKTSILDDVSNILPKIQSISTSDENALFVTERKLGKDSGFNDDVPRDCFIDNNKIGETEIECVLENAQPLCGMLKKSLDEELKQDMERFKSKVGMLQLVFLALEKEKVQLQKEVEKEKSKQRCFETQVMANQEDLDKLNTLPGNITGQQMKQKFALTKKDSSKIENENTAEDKDEKKFSSEERSKFMKMPMKGKLALNAKVSKKNKRQASKQKSDQYMSSSSENNFQVLDDSTFSETSQDEGRPTAKIKSEKNKVSIQMDVSDDLDLTRSSDTASEDVELPTSTYKEAMLLLEQLRLDHTDSAVLLKIQNILLEYERIIEREKNRYTAVWREARKLESEKESSQLIAEETQDLKSILAHQEVEWKSDIQSLKFTLKQEEEKRLRVETLYEKTRENLRKKEDQYCKEIEEKQQLELRSRNLEMELITLRKLLKQVEEERDETQRQLSQEKSARALQEGILNNHLWRQKELEEETRRTIEKNSEESNTEREKDLLHKNQLLQDEITMLRLELDQVRLRHQEEEGKYLEENETLKEKNEDLKKELKLNEEALTQTVFQYNGQLNLLKTESAVLNSKLEQTKESKDRLEIEIESFRSRLNTTVRERDEWLHLQDKLHHDLADVRETNKSLSQQLSKAESKANSLENECHQLKHTLREKTLLLEMTQKELSQAQCQAKECDHARQLEKDQVSKFMIKQESMQERLAHLQSENLLLRQQLEDMQNKGIIKEKVVNDVQDRFNDIFNKLRADTEKQVYLVEERNKELNAKCTDLREQVFKYETDKVEREGMVRQLQQELADALKKQSMSEASLEVTARYRSDLEEDKMRLQKELEKVKTKLRELEGDHHQSEHCVQELKVALDNKEKEVMASSQKVQELLLASSGTNITVKQLEEHVQRLEIENAKLEAAVQQQSNRFEALQRDLQASASIHNRLEDLIMSLRTTEAAAEDHHHQQMQKLAWTPKDSHSIWEEQLKLRSYLVEHVAQLDREKAELLEQCESERKKVKKLVELKRTVELHLDQEMKRNAELQKDRERLKKLLSRATKKLKVYEGRERESQLNLQGEMKNRYSEMANEVGRLRTKVGELSQQLEVESKKCMQLETQNQDLREELSTMRGNHEKLEKIKCQLKEEVANLKHRLETNMVDHSRTEQYKKEMEERAAQEIRQKLQEVNIFLQAQAASQDRLEQIRASHHASLRNQLKQRIRELEFELDRIKNTQQDNIFQKESTQAEVERYKELYLEEMKMRKCLANKLERTNEKLAEANAKLLQERHKSQSLITSSIVNGGLAATPVLYSTELGPLSNNLALNRSLSLGGSFLSPVGSALSSRNRVEAYVTKVRQELDEKINKEFEQATTELETGSTGASPVVSTDRSAKNVPVDQDPLCRAIQEYHGVLAKNNLI